jgi:hypothetical protein
MVICSKNLGGKAASLQNINIRDNMLSHLSLHFG